LGCREKGKAGASPTKPAKKSLSRWHILDPLAQKMRGGEGNHELLEVRESSIPSQVEAHTPTWRRKGVSDEVNWEGPKGGIENYRFNRNEKTYGRRKPARKGLSQSRTCVPREKTDSAFGLRGDARGPAQKKKKSEHTKGEIQRQGGSKGPPGEGGESPAAPHTDLQTSRGT